MALDIEFTDLHTKATTLVEKIATEKRDFTAEEKTENDAQTKRLNEIKTVLDSHKKLAGMAFMLVGTLVAGFGYLIPALEKSS